MKSFPKMLLSFSLAIVSVKLELSYRSRFSMSSPSSPTVLPFFGLKLIDGFPSLDEPTDISGVAAIAVLPVDGPDFIGSKRRTEPRDLTRKLKLLIVRSIS
jgi:hypothetical protein